MLYVGSTTQSLDERFEQHLRKAKNGNEGLFSDDLRRFREECFMIAEIDKSFIRHRFIIEEYHWHRLNSEGLPLYDIKRGASHSRNTIQRLVEARKASGFDYSSKEFKDRMSLATSGENNGMFGKTDENAVNGRVVVALNEQGDVVHTFPSVKTALQFLGLKGHAKLNEACRTGKLYKEYYWKKEWIDR